MPIRFCPHCGHRLRKGANFCSNCGKPITKESPEINILYNEENQCPNCGYIIDSLSIICPTCGGLIPRKYISHSVRDFLKQLYEIENEQHGILKDVANKIRKELLGLESFETKKLKRKIMLIKTFPVHKSIEDITEFMLLAESNIIVDLSKNRFGHKWGKLDKIKRNPDTLISDTWVEKMQSLYQQAELLFQSTMAFSQIKQIYERKMRALKIKI